MAFRTILRMDRDNNVHALNDGEDAANEADLVDVREQHGYTPWYFRLPDARKGKGLQITPMGCVLRGAIRSVPFKSNRDSRTVRNQHDRSGEREPPVSC